MKIKLVNKTISFMAMSFDSTEAYQRVYSNKDNDGILLFCFDDYSIKYGIEISNELIFNFQDRFFPDSLDLNEDEIYYLLGIIGKLFGYTTAKVYLPYMKENQLIYPKILETEKSFSNINLRYGFSEREFKTNFNSLINISNHPYEKFGLSNQIKTWKNYFKICKKNKTLEEFYQKWNEKFNSNLIENLYSLIDLTDFYQENNLEIEKIQLNKNVSDINRFRQRS